MSVSVEQVAGESLTITNANRTRDSGQYACQYRVKLSDEAELQTIQEYFYVNVYGTQDLCPLLC